MLNKRHYAGGATFVVLAISMCIALSVVGCTSSPTPSSTAVPTVEPTATLMASRKVALLFSYEADFWATLDEDEGVVEGVAQVGLGE